MSTVNTAEFEQSGANQIDEMHGHYTCALPFYANVKKYNRSFILKM